jgi:hypothetical protein
MGWLLLLAVLHGTPASAQRDVRAYPPDDTVTAAPQQTASSTAREWPDTSPKLSWYGWQPLLSDGLVLGLVTVSLLNPPLSLSGPALLLAALGPPIMHAAHGNLAAGAGSFALRLLGIAFIAVGAISTALSEGEDSIGVGLTITGAAIIGVTGVLDAALFSYARARSGRRHAELHVLPWASARAGAGGLSLQASF